MRQENYLLVGNQRPKREKRIIAQRLRPASAVANEQFSIDELMTHHLFLGQDSVQLGTIWLPPVESAHPHTTVNQDQAARFRRERTGFSRRRGTSSE